MSVPVNRRFKGLTDMSFVRAFVLVAIALVGTAGVRAVAAESGGACAAAQSAAHIVGIITEPVA